MIQGPRGVFVIIDMTTSLLALISNCLIMAAVVKTKLALGGYRRFLLSLAAADIVMASTTILTFSHQTFAERYHFEMLEKCGNNFLRSLTLIGYFSSLLSIAGLTADNFLGIFKPLRYNQLMTGNITKLTIVICWILSIVLSFIDMPITAVAFIQRQSSNIPVYNPPAFTTESSLTENTIYRRQNYPEQPIFSNSNKNNGTGVNYPGQSDNNGGDKLLAKFYQSRLLKMGPVVSNATYDFIPIADDFQINKLIQDVLHYVEVDQEPDDWCSFYSTNKFGVEFFVIGLTIPCFILLLVIYGRIFYEVMKKQDSAERNTKRLVLTTLLLIGSFTFCWVCSVFLVTFIHFPLLLSL